jgi:hypothetical protein
MNDAGFQFQLSCNESIEEKTMWCQFKQAYSRKKEKKMNYQLDQAKTNDQEDLRALCREGFTEEEIKRLSQLRRTQAEWGEHFTAAEGHRLAFVRWLVVTGKLSD